MGKAQWSHPAKSKKTASSLCRDAARVLATSPVPAFPASPPRSIPSSCSLTAWHGAFSQGLGTASCHSPPGVPAPRQTCISWCLGPSKSCGIFTMYDCRAVFSRGCIWTARDGRDVGIGESAKIRGAKSITQGETWKPLVKAKPGPETRRATEPECKQASENRAGRRVRRPGN